MASKNLLRSVKTAAGHRLRSKVRAVIFDLDDTLVRTSDLYAVQERRFFEFMGRLGFPEREAIREFANMEARHMRRLGYSIRRFPLSMVRTYERLCVKHGLRPSRSRRDAVVRIGRDVFRKVPRVMPGARSTLNELRRRGYSLIVASRGNPRVQRFKLSETGLDRCFDSVYILADKRKQDYRKILKREGLQRGEVVIVGDSVKSDINPAVGLGLLAVHIPYRHPTYEWTLDAEPPVSRNYVELSSIGELPRILSNAENERSRVSAPLST